MAPIITIATLRAATAGDLPAIAAIQATSPGAAQWDPASYLDYDCRVAEVSGSVAGFLVTRQVAPDEREILNLAVDSAKRRRGIARKLLAAAMGAKGAWFLEVRASNAAAFRLYESAGFKPMGVRKDYYYDPPEDCLVMRFFS